MSSRCALTQFLFVSNVELILENAGFGIKVVVVPLLLRYARTCELFCGYLPQS